ncbi:MAG: hypothetical protein AAF543_08205 [Pseudomonadota bacterium]
MRWLLITLLSMMLISHEAPAQSSSVQPGEVSLSVEVDAAEGQAPFTQEMVLITIKGLYRRHITREALEQPDFEGFNWAQLGPDKWTDERIDGKNYKIFERRMAVYPRRPGPLTIGAFTHRLTLTDEGDGWFEHKVMSEPVTIEVAPAPDTGDWWFPVSALRVSDEWSNAPARLKPGEGVLRVIRLEALGVTPEMIPPMPELTSPSALIFPHPEKRLVELSPAGPITYAFWRWTIRPTNNTSAIVEPLAFSYFDTTLREHRAVSISAQRVAYSESTADAEFVADQPPKPARLPAWPEGLAAAALLLGVIWSALRGRRLTFRHATPASSWLDPIALRLRVAAWRDDASGVRRTAKAIMARDGVAHYPHRQDALAWLDEMIFGPRGDRPELKGFARKFLRSTPVASIRPKRSAWFGRIDARSKS